MKRAIGFLDLAFELVEQTNNLVERTHDKVVARTLERFPPVDTLKQGAGAVTAIENTIASTVFESIRAINKIVRTSVTGTAELTHRLASDLSGDTQQELATPMDSSAAGSAAWCVDYAQSAINGFWGDHLVKSNSRLATPMTLRHQGRVLHATHDALSRALPEATPKVCVFVHGLASTEWLWHIASADHYEGDVSVSYGSRLQSDMGYTPVYLRYNTGRHISDNGRDLSELLDALYAAYPCAIEEIVLVGHSMGGLVVRSAAQCAREEDAVWVDALRHVACIGSPHLGAPLEKAVHVLTALLNRLDAAGAQVPAELLNSRSSGVKDLRYGYTHTDEWQGKDLDVFGLDDRQPFSPLDGVAYHFFAATISKDMEQLLGRVLGDLLVRVPSALGESRDVARRIPAASSAVFPGMNHMHILNHPEIYDALQSVLLKHS